MKLVDHVHSLSDTVHLLGWCLAIVIIVFVLHRTPNIQPPVLHERSLLPQVILRVFLEKRHIPSDDAMMVVQRTIKNLLHTSSLQVKFGIWPGHMYYEVDEGRL